MQINPKKCFEKCLCCDIIDKKTWKTRKCKINCDVHKTYQKVGSCMNNAKKKYLSNRSKMIIVKGLKNFALNSKKCILKNPE